MNDSQKKTGVKNPFPRMLLAALVLVVLAILAGGFWFYSTQERHWREMSENELMAIAQLKVSQIERWRTGRLADAADIMENPFYVEAFAHWLLSPDVVTAEKLLTPLRSVQKNNLYSNILLVDNNGKVLLELSRATERLADETLQQLAEALQTRKPAITDLHYSPGDTSPHLDVVAPLIMRQEGSLRAIGAVILCADADQYLYPLIQSWPMPSNTAETLLVRREGDQVLFLNELRHQKDTALKLRIPLSQADVPAAMAVSGKEGIVQGRDYRGVEVLAALKKIPDSPWFMVAKIDTAEAFSAMRFNTTLIVSLIIGLLVIASAIGGLLWQRRQRVVYQTLYQAEVEREALLRHFEYLVKYANDIIILADDKGRLVEVNDRALEAYAYTREEMYRLSITDIIAPEDIPAYQARLQEIAGKGSYLREGIHVRKDGSRFPVEASVRLVEVEGKRYLQAIIRDITERKRAEEQLKAANRLYALLSDVNQAIVRIKEREELFQAVCRIVVETGKFRMVWVGLIDEESGSIKPVTHYGYEEGYLQILSIGINDPPSNLVSTSRAIKEGKVATIDNIETDAGASPWREEALKRGYRSVAAVPLRLKGKVMGNLTILADTPGFFSDEEKKLLEEIGTDISYALEGMETEAERKQAEAQLKAANRLYALLSDVNQAIVRIKERGELFQTVCRIAVETGGFRMAWVGLHDEKSGAIKPVAHYGYEQGYLQILSLNTKDAPSKSVSTSITINEGKVTTIDNIETDAGALTFPWHEEALKRGYRSVAAVPIRLKSKIIGNFTLLAGEPEAFSDEEKKLLEEIGQDISYALDGMETEVERRKAEKALRESEELYRSLFENMLNGFAYCRMLFNENQPQDFIYLDVNKAFETQTGLKNVVGKKVSEVIPGIKESDPGLLEIYGRVALTGKPERFETYVAALDMWFSISVYSPQKEYFVAVFDVITERKKAEEALRRSEEKLRAITSRQEAIIAAIPDIIMEVDNNKVYTWANRAGTEFFGGDVIGREAAYYFEGEQDTYNVVQPLFNGDENVIYVESWQRRRDGQKRLLAWWCRVLKDESGKITGALSSARDITELQHLEEERQRVAKLESVGLLAGGIAHDFNNILTAILGNISLARMETKPGEELHDRLTEAEKASFRAKDLTQQLLTFAKGGAPIKKTAAIAELVRDTASFVLRGSNVSCEFSLPADLWPANVDQGQISQVINNLVINAQQAMPGGGTIEVRAENITLTGQQRLGKNLPLKQGDYIRVSVTDHGTGIPAAHLSKIFDPYFTTKQKGSGLGLATSYSIVHNHGGHIGVESKMGAGSTFYIYLPAAKKKAPPKQEKAETIPAGSGRILVMDDEAAVREVAGRMLRHIGYEDVQLAADGAEAIRVYKEALDSGKPFAAVILDLTIPGGMGGKETVKKLLEIDPDVKAIVSSGYSSDPISAEHKEYGFKGMVNKPYTLEQLRKGLHEVLG